MLKISQNRFTLIKKYNYFKFNNNDISLKSKNNFELSLVNLSFFS